MIRYGPERVLPAEQAFGVYFIKEFEERTRTYTYQPAITESLHVAMVFPVYSCPPLVVCSEGLL